MPLSTMRVFRVDLVIDVALEEETFTPRPDFHALETPAETFRRDAPPVPVQVQVRFSPAIARWLAERYRLARPLEGGGLEMEFPVLEPHWLVRHILQYGADAEVVEPPAVRALMRRVPGGGSAANLRAVAVAVAVSQDSRPPNGPQGLASPASTSPHPRRHPRPPALPPAASARTLGQPLPRTSMTETPKPKRKPAAPKGGALPKGGTAASEASAEPRPVHAEPITADDLHLFNEGSHYHLYRKLGCHLTTLGGTAGATFAVWAPSARAVSVIGDFNGWDPRTHRLATRGASGIWEGFIGGVRKGDGYKFHVTSRHGRHRVDKADPLGIHQETPPKTGSKVWDLEYEWSDGEWMAGRGARIALASPVSIYEVHLGSWMRVPEDGNRSLSYREMADRLVPYVTELGFTHVEFLPVTEHPFFGSWGYQTTGYFAPTSRYGTPQDLMFLIDRLHQAGVGVILDWVPSHFPADEHGLAYFDGTHLFEHADARQGFHPDWSSSIFNYGRHEVRSFLLSSAFLWLDVYHADALRVDAVASMLYLDYSRKSGEWVPNRFGGRENLDAVEFLRRFNTAVYERHPDVQTIAEESTSWPGVSRPVHLGGLGFGLKWDMGWMHDTLRYLSRDPVHRRFHHHDLTFRSLYLFTENFCLPLSHDEVVHGKGSLLGRMPGDEWQRFANLRTLLACQYTQPGKKLLFMGCEIGQRGEWDHESSVEWHLLDQAPHRGVQALTRDLNRLLRSEPALHQLDTVPDGFEWVDANDTDHSVLTWLRKGADERDVVLVACNFTPVPRYDYLVGVPRAGFWCEVLNTDAAAYGGSGLGNFGGAETTAIPWHGRAQSLNLVLPPLAVVVLRHQAAGESP